MLSKDNEELTQQAELLLHHAQDGKIVLYAPELSKYEVANVILKGKKLNPTKANIVLSTFYILPITFITENTELTQSAYAMAYTNNLSFYDACFLAVAKQLDATLVTDNMKHQGNIPEIAVTSLMEYK